jgi:cytidylate kinase
MDGRDIGSVVFPNAEYKFYIDASIKERSHRRWTELKESESNITIENVEKDLINRDFNDTNRSISPLKIPENAVIINSDDKSIKNVVDEIVGLIKSNS